MSTKAGFRRVTATISEEEYQRLLYWAEKKECTINDYMRDAIEQAIRFENRDYNLPVMEVQRMNQLVELITVLSSNVQNLEDVVTHGFDSLLGLTRGDNYLLEAEDGEI